MRNAAGLTTFMLCVALAGARTAGAQSDSARVPGEFALERARELASAGKTADGRALIDSVLTASTPQNPIYGEALYTRASLAPNAAEAERDYRRLLIETPLAPRAEDAMLQLANLLQARGDRRGASEYLQRFMLNFANSPARPRVAVSLVRLLFEQGPSQEARACEALRQGRAAVPRENFELRNQLEFYAPRCAMYAESAPTPVTTPVTAPVTTPVTTPEAAQARLSFYSVQIAAYASEEAAQRVVKILLERGLEARVDGETAPFRVRIGKYATRAEAAKALATLKSRGHPGFIAVVGGR